jgi:hypothetical protein
MNLPVPIVSVDPGPDWATNINACMAAIDGHDHSTGKGVPIANVLLIPATLPATGTTAILATSSTGTTSAPFKFLTVTSTLSASATQVILPTGYTAFLGFIGFSQVLSTSSWGQMGLTGGCYVSATSSTSNVSITNSSASGNNAFTVTVFYI